MIADIERGGAWTRAILGESVSVYHSHVRLSSLVFQVEML